VQRRLISSRQTNSEYAGVRVQLHGISVPPLVNVADLRKALGLPIYRLRPPFRPPTDLETPMPAVNIEDHEHSDERAEAMEQQE
jgi:hypothetical protein